MTAASPEIVINGETYPLRLTLGALAAIEDVVGGGDFAALHDRLKKPRVADLVFILHALAGGGGKAIALETLKAADVDLSAAAHAIAQAFKALDPQAENAPSGAMEAPGKSLDPASEGTRSKTPSEAAHSKTPSEAAHSKTPSEGTQTKMADTPSSDTSSPSRQPMESCPGADGSHTP